MKKTKLKEVTFCLGDEPSRVRGNAHLKALLWCDKTPRGKRMKPVKINGIVTPEIVPHNPLQNG